MSVFDGNNSPVRRIGDRAEISATRVSDLSSADLKHVRPKLRLKCDDTRAETRFSLPAKRTSPFKSAGVEGRGGRQFSLLLAVEVCISAVVMLDIPCSEVV